MPRRDDASAEEEKTLIHSITEICRMISTFNI